MRMVEIADRLLIETGLSKEFLLKEIKVNEALNTISAMPVDYALYGGTAINKIYIGQRRFSEDIDLFVYGMSEKEFTKLAKKAFPGISEPKCVFREAYRYWIPYSFEEHGVKDLLKLDANFNFKKSEVEVVAKEPGSFLNGYGFFIRNRDIRTFTKTTLTANKLVAISNRSAGRDYFDLYHLLQGESPKRTLIMEDAHKHANAFFDFMRFDENFLIDAVGRIRAAKAEELGATDQYILKRYRPEWRELVKNLASKVKAIAQGK